MRSQSENAWSVRWWTWLAWTLFASLLLAGGAEWEHYRRLFRWQSLGLSGWERGALFWILWGTTLLLFTPCLVLAALTTRLRSRAGDWLLLAGATIFSAWILFDARTEEVTGNHLSTYIAQADMRTLQFAGGASWMLRYLAMWLVLIGTGAVLLWKVCRAGCARGGGRSRAWLAGGVVAILGGLPPAILTFSKPNVLARLHGAMPVNFSWLGVRSALSPELRQFEFPFEAAANAVLQRVGPRLQKPAPADERFGLAAGSRPDIVFVLIESLRAEALNPKWMPLLDTWSRDGLRFSNHYAGGNCSPTGLFELLYGRSCLKYNATLDASVLPQACVTLRRSGYRATYLATLDDTKWMRGGDFLNARAFDRVAVSGRANWPEGDRWTIAEARKTLREGGDQPQFVVLFLGSTHHPYPCPPEARRFTPALPEGWTILDSDLRSRRGELRNSYANAVAFLDTELNGLLRALDLTRTIVVVTSDHGEALFDDNTASHSSRLSPAQTQVPLVLRGRGIPVGVCDEVSVHADVLPTVLHAAAGNAVDIPGISGVDFLDRAPGAGPRSVLLTGFPSRDPVDAAIVRGTSRVGFYLSLRHLQIAAAGLLNDDGLVDAEHPLRASDADEWARGFEEEIERIAR